MMSEIDGLAIVHSWMGSRSPDAVLVSDIQGHVLYLNPAGLALLGISEPQTVTSLTMNELFAPSGVAAGELQTALTNGNAWRGVSRLKNLVTGQPVPVEITAFMVDQPDTEAGVAVFIARDQRNALGHHQLKSAVEASSYSAAEQQAVARLSRLALNGELDQLLDAATTAAMTLMGVHRSMIIRPSEDDPDAISVVSFAGEHQRPVTLPSGRSSLMGYALMTDDVVVCEDRDVETRFSTEAMAAHGLRSGVAVPIPSDTGPWGTLSVHSRTNRTYGDRELSFLQTVSDVLSAAIRRLDLDRQLRERSLRDPLTGLPNRTMAYDRVERALSRAKRDGTLVALMLLDIDDFKIVNDSLGHEAGDRALVRFARRLAAAARPQDTVARLGGDEFLIVAEQIVDSDHALELARAVVAGISSAQPPGIEPTPVSASIGIAVSDTNSTRRDLIHHADLAMYRAKDAGTGACALFDDGDLYDADRTRRLSLDLRAALGDGELNLLYQPIFEINSGKLVAMEALARWRHSDLGVIDPTEFIAVAERTGVVGDLGQWALHTACTQAALWRTFSDVEIRVNVSALQLRDPEFADTVAAVLDSTGLDPTALGLEITETVWVSDTASVAETLFALRDLGVGMSLDDLGSGYSSIAYLNRYPVFKCFKIDKSYIADLPAERPSAIISAIVMLARAFDLHVVGEGVETTEQLDSLRACGCDLAQGFLLGRPMTADEATRELSRRSTLKSFSS